jgi:hypothetical protein
MRSITVRVANNYGNKVIYPVCDDALLFAYIAGTKTLTAANIGHIKMLGYTINVQQEEL